MKFRNHLICGSSEFFVDPRSGLLGISTSPCKERLLIRSLMFLQGSLKRESPDRKIKQMTIIKNVKNEISFLQAKITIK